MITDVQSTVARLNRMYLTVIRELAIENGIEVAAKILGMQVVDVEWLVSLSPVDIEEIADIGLPLVRIHLPEKQKWTLLPRDSRKNWVISQSAERAA